MAYLHRYLCDVLKEMRKAVKTKNYSYLPGLIEEAQSMGNRMEAGLFYFNDQKNLRKKIKILEKTVNKLEKKKKKLQKQTGTDETSDNKENQLIMSRLDDLMK